MSRNGAFASHNFRQAQALAAMTPKQRASVLESYTPEVRASTLAAMEQVTRANLEDKPMKEVVDAFSEMSFEMKGAMLRRMTPEERTTVFGILTEVDKLGELVRPGGTGVVLRNPKPNPDSRPR